MKTLGQIAYEAYCVCINNLSVTGVVLPKWDGQSDSLKSAWCSAAKAVVEVQYRRELDSIIEEVL